MRVPYLIEFSVEGQKENFRWTQFHVHPVQAEKHMEKVFAREYPQKKCTIIEIRPLTTEEVKELHKGNDPRHTCYAGEQADYSRRQQ